MVDIIKQLDKELNKISIQELPDEDLFEILEALQNLKRAVSIKKSDGVKELEIRYFKKLNMGEEE